MMLTGCSRAEELKAEERRSRTRLGESLDALRPTMSVKGKQPPAEATPTLYDIVRFCWKFVYIPHCQFTAVTMFVILQLFGKTVVLVEGHCQCYHLVLLFISLYDKFRRTVSRCLVKRSRSQFSDHCFATAGPTLWNSLPEQLWQPDITFGQFK